MTTSITDFLNTTFHRAQNDRPKNAPRSPDELDCWRYMLSSRAFSAAALKEMGPGEYEYNMQWAEVAMRQNSRVPDPRQYDTYSDEFRPVPMSVWESMRVSTTQPKPKPPAMTQEEAIALLTSTQAAKPSALRAERPELSSYAETAKRLGFYTDGMPKTLVESALADLSIPSYDIKAVHTYMDNVLVAERVLRQQPYLIWFWRDLNGKGKHWTPTADESNQYSVMKANGLGMKIPPELSKPYDKPIPKYVLERAIALQDLLGVDEVQFAVTDYGVSDPDPFLMGIFRGHKFVFAVWDEPGF